MAKTRAQENRAIRQEALREQLCQQGHVQHIVDICEELNDLSITLEASEIQRKKIVLDTKLSLIKKYIPDLKNTEISGDGGGSLTIKVVDYTDQHND